MLLNTINIKIKGTTYRVKSYPGTRKGTLAIGLFSYRGNDFVAGFRVCPHGKLAGEIESWSDICPKCKKELKDII